MKLIAALPFLLFSLNSFAFETFENELKRVTINIGCIKPKTSPASGDWGRLYSCIGGREQTVKFFINEIPGQNKVKDIKVLWNDYAKDVGYGLHVDADIARAWMAAMATLYAPLQVENVLAAFDARTNVIIENEKYILAYTYSRGPAIDERMFVIRQKGR